MTGWKKARLVTRVCVAAIFLADLLPDWSHRLFHRRWLWRFHAIHHSSRTVDWLSTARRRPKGIDKNPAGLLPFIDLAFGTF